MQSPAAARVAVFTMLVSTTIALAGAQSNLPPIPAKPGAAGTLQVGKTSVTITHVYVGTEESDETLYRVLLVDRAIPAGAIAKELQRGGGQMLLRTGKLDGVMLLVDGTGFVRTAIPFAGELRGSSMLASVGRLQNFTAKDGVTTGQGALEASQTMNQGWSYAASWNAKVFKP
jgi:hypothetical protein